MNSISAILEVMSGINPILEDIVCPKVLWSFTMNLKMVPSHSVVKMTIKPTEIVNDIHNL
jgi:hypothetical protein